MWAAVRLMLQSAMHTSKQVMRFAVCLQERLFTLVCSTQCLVSWPWEIEYFNVQEVQRGSGYDTEIWVRCDEDEMEVDDDEEEEEEEEEDLSLASLINLDHLRAAKRKEQIQNFDWTTDDWPGGNWS